ncbi:MAG: MFS transporter [Bacteroidaceae bacterium]|nr:MFS transporter [Bacteroidaceae bacterium]
MSIHVGKKEISAVSAGRKNITAKYEGLHLVWQSVRSCFGSGWWIRQKPWKGTDGWKYKHN